MRTEHYFADVNLVPLLVQENYIHAPGTEQSLEALADTAESIFEVNTCNKIVKGSQRSKLMMTYIVLSAVQTRCTLAGGHVTPVQFL